MANPAEKKLTPAQAASLLRGLASSPARADDEDTAWLSLAGLTLPELLEVWRLLGNSTHRHSGEKLCQMLVAWPARQRVATGVVDALPSMNRGRRDRRPLSDLGVLPPLVAQALNRCDVWTLGQLANLLLATGVYRGVCSGLSPAARNDLKARLMKANRSR